MNHWFLVGRDIMWGGVFMLPLLLAMISGIATQKDDADPVGFMFAAVLVHMVVTAFIFEGVIR